MNIITIKLTDKEFKVFNGYAQLKNKSLSVLMKQTLEEKIMDELDIDSISMYEEKFNKKETEFVSLEDIKDKLNL